MEIFPVGAALNDGRYRITEHLRGTRDRGMYRARSVLDLARGSLLVTCGSEQMRPLRALNDELALAVPKIAPLRFIGAIEAEGVEGIWQGLVEQEPEGQTVDVLRPFNHKQVIAFGLELCAVLAGAHAAGKVIAGLRPELIYASSAAGHLTINGVAPRAERFLATATPPCYGVAPMFDAIYAAPEQIELRPLTPACDVFSACVIIAELTADEFPFVGENPLQQVMSIVRGRRRRFEGGLALRSVLEAGLAPDPAARPSVAALAADLSRALAS